MKTPIITYLIKLATIRKQIRRKGTRVYFKSSNSTRHYRVTKKQARMIVRYNNVYAKLVIREGGNVCVYLDLRDNKKDC